MKVLQQVRPRITEAFHLIAHLGQERILVIARGQITGRIEDLREDLAAAGELLGCDGETRFYKLVGEMPGYTGGEGGEVFASAVEIALIMEIAACDVKSLK